MISVVVCCFLKFNFGWVWIWWCKVIIFFCSVVMVGRMVGLVIFFVFFKGFDWWVVGCC